MSGCVRSRPTYRSDFSFIDIVEPNPTVAAGKPNHLCDLLRFFRARGSAVSQYFPNSTHRITGIHQLNLATRRGAKQQTSL
jgi:hypothetical protein